MKKVEEMTDEELAAGVRSLLATIGFDHEKGRTIWALVRVLDEYAQEQKKRFHASFVGRRCLEVQK